MPFCAFLLQLRFGGFGFAWCFERRVVGSPEIVPVSSVGGLWWRPRASLVPCLRVSPAGPQRVVKLLAVGAAMAWSGSTFTARDCR